MPLTILLGAVMTLAVLPAMSVASAFLLAAILAPTDAALGQSVVSSTAVPVRIRQALNVESGLNDGIVLPLVLIFAIWAGAPNETGGALGIAGFAALQLTVGPAIGTAMGHVGARLIDGAAQANWITPPFQGIAILALWRHSPAPRRWAATASLPPSSAAWCSVAPCATAAHFC